MIPRRRFFVVHTFDFCYSYCYNDCRKEQEVNKALSGVQNKVVRWLEAFIPGLTASAIGMGASAAFMHHLYCPIYVNGEAGLAKIYVAETFGNAHKFYLLKIEKASSDMGFNYVSEVSTPDSEAASEDAAISVADIFSFVKDHDVKYEENSAYSVHFSPKRANPLFMNEDGTPKVFYMLAVESGDMDAAQEMVDEAAKKAGFTYRRNSRNVLDLVNGTPWTMYGDSLCIS